MAEADPKPVGASKTVKQISQDSQMNANVHASTNSNSEPLSTSLKPLASGIPKNAELATTASSGGFSGIASATVSPQYLISNSTSHKWLFGAFAEIIDNALDVGARTLWIDFHKALKESPQCGPQLEFTDDGQGMLPMQMHRMLGFGHSGASKIVKIGQYGNGFKSGSQRVGQGSIVFSKRKNKAGELVYTIGMLSFPMHRVERMEQVLIPMISYDSRMQPRPISSATSAVLHEKNLGLLRRYSPFNTEAVLKKEFDKIGSPSGTRILLYHLKYHENRLEINTVSDPKDIRLWRQPEAAPEQARKDEACDDFLDYPEKYSLMAYLKVLYMHPKMAIVLRGYHVPMQRIKYTLMSPRGRGAYKPKAAKDTCESVEIFTGFNKRQQRYGVMLYHRNRLIVFMLKLGIMKQGNSRGQGMVCVADIGNQQKREEGKAPAKDLYVPQHNKQGFMENGSYRLLLNRITQQVLDSWKLAKIDKADHGIGIRTFWDRMKVAPSDYSLRWERMCCKCRKWRRLPVTAGVDNGGVNAWHCGLNVGDAARRSCDAPEETLETLDKLFEVQTPLLDVKERKRQEARKIRELMEKDAETYARRREQRKKKLHRLAPETSKSPSSKSSRVRAPAPESSSGDDSEVGGSGASGASEEETTRGHRPSRPAAAVSVRQTDRSGQKRRRLSGGNARSPEATKELAAARREVDREAELRNSALRAALSARQETVMLRKKMWVLVQDLAPPGYFKQSQFDSSKSHVEKLKRLDVQRLIRHIKKKKKTR